MAAPLSNHPYEVLFTRPNAKDREGTRKKLLDGFEILKQHPDFMGVTLEGLGVEDSTLGLRIVQWTCEEGHMRFRASKQYADFTKVREGAYLSPPEIVHYNFTDWINHTPTPPILEVMDVTLKPDIAFAEWKEACKPIIQSRKDASGFVGYTVGRQLEDSRKVLVICGWESLGANADYLGSKAAKDLAGAYKMVDEKYQGSFSSFHVQTCEPGHGV